MYCSKCGTYLQDGDAFCNNCGNPRNNNEDVVQSVVEAPVVQEPVQPVVDTPVVQEQVQPVVDTPVVQEQVQPVVDTPVVQEQVQPVVDTPVVQEPIQPVVDTPVVQEQVQPVVESSAFASSSVEQVNNFNQPVQQTQSFEFNKPAQTFEINNQPAFDGGFVNTPAPAPKKKKSSAGVIIIAILLIAAIIGGVWYFTQNNENKENGGGGITTPTNTSRPTTNAEYDRTIMIYMSGSNLESEIGLATEDFKGLDYNKLTNNGIKIVLIAGGTSKWWNSYIDKSSTSIYEYTSNGFEVVKKQSLKNLGDASTLSDFLNYAYTNYKSNKYILMFWDHGGAVTGAIQDDLSRGDSLDLQEFRTAFNNSPFKGNNKLEMIIFRTCLNSTIEVSSVLKDYANYLVASEESTIGYRGNSVLAVLNNISKSDSSIDIGKKWVNNYFDYISYYESRAAVTMYQTYSVTDLSKVSELVTAVDDFFGDINTSNNYNYISYVRSNLYQYANEVAYYDMVDLYNLVEGLKSLSPTKGQKVLDLLNSAIIYNKAPDYRSKGLSIYFPYNGEKAYQDYVFNAAKKGNVFNKYNSFLTSFSSFKNSSYSGLDFSNNLINISNATSKEADFELDLTDDQKDIFAKAEYVVWKKNDDGTFIPAYRGKNVTLDGNTLKANVKGRQLKMSDKEGKEERFIFLVEDDETDEYIRYKASIVLELIDFPEDSLDFNYDIHAANMALVLDKKTNKITIGEISLLGDDDHSLNPVLVSLKDYTHIVVGSTSYKLLDENGNMLSDWESNGTFEGLELKVDDFKIDLYDYSDGAEYYAFFYIWDTHNNVYTSKLVKMK